MARERVLQDTKVRPVLKLLASLPDEPGADCFTPAHLLARLTYADDPEFELDLCKPSYHTLLVCNSPAAVAALAMPHNIERVQQVSRIIVLLFLSEDAKDYGQWSVKFWEELTGGEGGRFGRLSDALVRDEAINQKCRALITMNGRHPFEDTVFGQRALGYALLSQLLNVFRNDMASKQLSFAIFRDTHTANSTGPADRDLAIGPSMASWHGGVFQDRNDTSSEDNESMSQDDESSFEGDMSLAGDIESLSGNDKDISLVLVEGLLKLQSPDAPVYVVMETEDDEDLDKVRCAMRKRGYRNVVPRRFDGADGDGKRARDPRS